MHLEDKYFQAFDTSMEMHVDVIESCFKSTGDLVSELVVLYTQLSMFSKFLMHGWSNSLQAGATCGEEVECEWNPLESS